MQANNVAQIIANNILQHGCVVNNNLVSVPPVAQETINDGHEAMDAISLIGFLTGKPVYRTTYTVAHHMEEMGVFYLQWPPLFLDIWLPECDLLQCDVTIRTQFYPVPSVDNDDDDDDDGDDGDDEDGYDADSHDEDGSDDDGYNDDYESGLDNNYEGGSEDDRSDDDDYDDDHGDDYDDLDYIDLDYIEEQQEIEATIDCLDKIDIK